MINCFKTADICAERASAVCADGKSEEEAGFNNESAGGNVKDTPEEENVTTSMPPDTGGNIKSGDIWELMCYGPMGMVLLLFVMLFVRKE
jgi:hypothetical protein